MTRDELLGRLKVLLGGRVSEEIIFGDISTGAQNDLQRATDIARRMIMEYGMSEKLGPLTYVNEQRSAHLDLGLGSRDRDFSEKTAQQIDEEISGIIEGTHQSVRKILTQQRSMLEKLAKILLEKESIDGEELKKFFDEVKAMIAEDGSKKVA
jgi:cell division protease FtsH